MLTLTKKNDKFNHYYLFNILTPEKAEHNAIRAKLTLGQGILFPQHLDNFKKDMGNKYDQA